MSGPDVIDGRFDDLVREVRSGEVTASPELRERVRAIVEREPEPPLATGQLRARWRRVGRRRRVGLALVPVAGILAAAVGVGVFTSGSTHWQPVSKPTGQFGDGSAHGQAKTATELLPQHAYSAQRGFAPHS